MTMPRSTRTLIKKTGIVILVESAARLTTRERAMERVTATMNRTLRPERLIIIVVIGAKTQPRDVMVNADQKIRELFCRPDQLRNDASGLEKLIFSLPVWKSKMAVVVAVCMVCFRLFRKDLAFPTLTR